MRHDGIAAVPEPLLIALGPGEGKIVWRSVPLVSGKDLYWHAAARIQIVDGRIIDAAIALQGPQGAARRLSVVENRLMCGEINGADAVLDAVSSLVECEDDPQGSAALKSYMAGWVCADTVGRCLAANER